MISTCTDIINKELQILFEMCFTSVAIYLVRVLEYLIAFGVILGKPEFHCRWDVVVPIFGLC